MAAEATIYSRKLTIKLNDGTSSGRTITRNVNFPSMARNDGLSDSARNQSYLDLANAYENVSSREIYEIDATRVERITAA